MAIARGAGTEIIRTAMFEDIDSTTQKLIIGEQHHIYTVLSIVICCASIQAAGNQININLQGYDSKGGTTDETMRLFRWQAVANDTFVWNDKFSFNGRFCNIFFFDFRNRNCCISNISRNYSSVCNF